MSLKKTLQFLIKSEGVVGIEDIDKLCHEQGYKLSNAERRLRELSAIEEVEPIYNPKKTAIIAYKVFKKPKQETLI